MYGHIKHAFSLRSAPRRVNWPRHRPGFRPGPSEEENSWNEKNMFMCLGVKNEISFDSILAQKLFASSDLGHYQLLEEFIRLSAEWLGSPG